jgi:hypothetical protein
MKGYQAMDSLLQEIKDKLGKNNDFFLQRDYIVDIPFVLLGYKTLIDLTQTRITLQKYIDLAVSTNKTIDELLEMIGEVKGESIEAAVSSIIEGKMIIYIEKYSKYIVMDPAPKLLNRATVSPTNENVLQGPLSSFIEDIDFNIGVVRKEINSEKMVVTSFTVGSDQKKKLSLLYFEGHTDMKLVDKIKIQLEKNQDKEINNLQNLSKTLGFPAWVAVSKFNTTELPQEAVHSLIKGKVVLFVDRLPFALVLPNLLWDMFALENDRNYPLPIMLIIRIIRIVGVLSTLIIPGLYVALVSVNPEVLRIELALSIARSREGVPYPAIVEIILLLIVLELVIEASVRLPKSIGPTITMVGGIILGQAVVAAQLVSNLLIIVLAATTIANSTVVGFQNSLSIRLFKYILVILASIFGVLGLLTGLVLVSGYFANLNTFGISYLHIYRSKGEVKNG